MQPRIRLTRPEAAVLLGVPPDASPSVVRHAWRMWARIAHPDFGGDPEHFARLEQARRVMMIADPDVIPVLPRLRLREVLRLPEHPLLMATGLLIALALSALCALPALVGDEPSLLAIAVACLPGAIAAAGIAAAITRECLTALADRGHRIIVVSVVWLGVAVLQVSVAALLGVDLLPVLPVLAIPIVAVVASMDPAVGLWRPTPASRG